MRPLKPFSPTSITLKGELRWKPGEVVVEFALHDPQNEVQDSLKSGSWKSWPRADELWKTTCFEAFWAVPGQKGYWELNLSPSKSAWNVYFFDDYRDPQPPRATTDFELVAIESTSTELRVRLRANIELPRVEANLNAIIRTAAATNYFAVEHAFPKADFHSRAAFILSLKSS